MEFTFLTLLESLFLAGLAVTMPIVATIHVIRTKHQVGSVIAWVSFVWFVPIIGIVIYLLFGINRVRRRAAQSRSQRGLAPRGATLDSDPGKSIQEFLPDLPPQWKAHAVLSGRVSRRPLCADNQITPLLGGRQAYDHMISAIEKAQKFVVLTTYIFQADQAGRRFIKALERAHDRGVEIRVLVDAVGNWYGFKPVTGLLGRQGIKVASFNPVTLSWRLAFFNLRTHRKLMIVDGQIGYAGGMNIRKHYLADKDAPVRVDDTHFHITGPVVEQLMEAFADDWAFSSSEELTGDAWFPAVDGVDGKIVARGIADGPDEDRPKLLTIMDSALAAAQSRILIITPYFIPDPKLLHSLTLAALRGVAVHIVVPKKSNLPFFDIAAESNYRELLKVGVHIHRQPAPFDHSKLILVDHHWMLFGSSNWDARSMRLNFEFNVELFGDPLPDRLLDLMEQKLKSADEVSLEMHNKRPVWRRALGGLLWLFSPYL